MVNDINTVHTLHTAPFSDDVKHRYTEGGCFRLARALSELTGKPIVRIGEIHGAVYLDEDRGIILDVLGIWEYNTWFEEWDWGLFRDQDGALIHRVIPEDWSKNYEYYGRNMTDDVDQIAAMLVAWAQSLHYL